MTTITVDTVVSRSEDEISTEISGAFVLMNPELDEFYDLNPTASAVWAELAEPMPVAELRDRLVERFDVEPDVCEREIITLLGDLAQRDMIVATG